MVLGVCTTCAHYSDTNRGPGAHHSDYECQTNLVRQEGEAFQGRRV
jgi:hypothetical protein